jgi:hypothetical protein
MAGEMVSTTPPEQDSLDGAASVTASHSLVSIIFGGVTGSASISMKGFQALAPFGTRARVTLQYVPSSGRFGVVAGPSTVSTKTYAIKSGVLTVSIEGMDASSGYRLLVTPA